MYIYLMRHGETDWNVKRRMQGQSDIPLNERGLAQARAAAQGLKDVPFDRILCSPLIRTHQTAQAVAEGRGLAIEEEPRLIEMGFGDLEGLSVREHKACQIIFSDPEHYVPVGSGESYAVLDERCRAIMEELIPPMEGQYEHVLMVSHGATIKGVVRRLKGRSIAQFWQDPPQKNCSCTVLECKNGVLSLIEEGRVYG